METRLINCGNEILVIVPPGLDDRKLVSALMELAALISLDLDEPDDET